MDPNPRSFPILSYVMSKLPKLGSFTGSSYGVDEFDIEQPLPPPPQQQSDYLDGQILDRMPRLNDPEVLASMTRAISDISQTRSVLQMLGERPDHESVDTAKAKIAEIDGNLSKHLGELVLMPRPSNVERLEWRSHLADKEKEIRQLAQNEKLPYKAVIQLDEMHEAYEKLLKDAEEKLVKIYESTESSTTVDDAGAVKVEDSQVDDEVIGILQEALGNGIEKVNLSGRRLRFIPEAFGRIRGLVVLNLASNQLEVIPDSIAGLTNLEELNLSSNLLESLPDSIGLLHNLKILNVSTNKLKTLPDSICQSRSLVELDASFNSLTYLPTNIGHELMNLKKLIISLNKIRFLPTSICEMRSLTHLDVHFNELHGLPVTIGKLTNLETLNLSSNFTDLTELPDTIGDLTNLKELDLSNNQIHTLPDTFGRLENLVKLKLNGNPIVVPPLEVVNEGVESVKLFMAKRWIDILVEEEVRSKVEMQELTQTTGWVTRGTSWLSSIVSGVSGLTSGGRFPRDPFLDQQL